MKILERFADFRKDPSKCSLADLACHLGVTIPEVLVLCRRKDDVGNECRKVIAWIEAQYTKPGMVQKNLEYVNWLRKQIGVSLL